VTCWRDHEEVLRNRIKELEHHRTVLQHEATQRVEERRNHYMPVSQLLPELATELKRIADLQPSSHAQLVLAYRLRKFNDGIEEHGPLDLYSVDLDKAEIDETVDWQWYRDCKVIRDWLLKKRKED